MRSWSGPWPPGCLPASVFEHHRLPEVFSGHERSSEQPFPAFYPQANAPQAWSASARWRRRAGTFASATFPNAIVVGTIGSVDVTAPPVNIVVPTIRMRPRDAHPEKK